MRLCLFFAKGRKNLHPSPKVPKSRNTNTANLYTYIQPYISLMIFTYNHISLDSSIIKDWRFVCWNCWPFRQTGCCHLQLLKDGHSSSPFLGSFTWVSSPTHILLGVGPLDPPPFPENSAFNDNEGLGFIATGTPKKPQTPKKCKENPCVFLLITITHPLEEDNSQHQPDGAYFPDRFGTVQNWRSPIGVFWKKHLGTLKHWNGDKFQKEWFFFPRWIMKNEMEMKMLLLYNPSKLFESSTDKVSSFAKRKSSTPKCLYARGNVIIPWRVSLELPTAVKFQCIQQGGACCGFLFLKYVEDAVLFVVWDGFQNEVHTYRTIQSCAWGFFSVLNAANHTSISSCPNGFWWSRKKQSS